MPDDALPWLYGTAKGVISNQRRGARRQAALQDTARAGAITSAACLLVAAALIAAYDSRLL